MTKEEAKEKAIELDCLLNDALNIERELERAGYRCSELVRK